MTRAQTGAALVAGDGGKLLGIFTDGDFRRAVVGGCSDMQAFAKADVASCMTPDPLFVYEDAYAAELLKIFERRRIDDLPVCDRSGRVVGLVDIQDLPKMKVL
jgi:arabinose-5-phosphate isomerase